MLKYLYAIAIWLAPPLVVVALPTDAPELTCLAIIYLYLGGLILALAFFISFFATRSKAHAANAFVLVVLMWLLVWHYGFTAAARIHLLVNERRYLTTIAELGRAKSNEEKVRICGEGCDARYPRSIVAFHYCHCFLYWPDLVYAPNGELDESREELQKIGFYLHGSTRLSKNWYIGYFGD
jgi:hypothetical protein